MSDMNPEEQKLVERMALYIADEACQLGFHEGRWYNPAQKKKYLRQAKNVIQLLRSEGFVIGEGVIRK